MGRGMGRLAADDADAAAGVAVKMEVDPGMHRHGVHNRAAKESVLAKDTRTDAMIMVRANAAGSDAATIGVPKGGGTMGVVNLALIRVIGGMRHPLRRPLLRLRPCRVLERCTVPPGENSRRANSTNGPNRSNTCR